MGKGREGESAGSGFLVKERKTAENTIQLLRICGKYTGKNQWEAKLRRY